MFKDSVLPESNSNSMTLFLNNLHVGGGSKVMERELSLVKD